MNNTSERCGCAICALQLDFEFDSHLLNEIERHACVIFAGAGISTESGYTHPESFYETVCDAAEIRDNIPFWEAVDKFENKPNGRQKFIQLIKDRFNYIDSFRDLVDNATRFHRSLSNAPFFGTIITTNWDTYFEDVVGATPFVYDADIPFWETAKRPLLKIHGSIDNFSSIVASSADYETCEQRLREGALGAVLKQIFATKTCIFCGYSTKDADFRNIFKTIKDGLGQFARNHYLVSPYVSTEEAAELKESLGVIAIKTDATYFVEMAKRHMQEKFCYSKDESFGVIAKELIRFQNVHDKFVSSYSPVTKPHLIYSTAYQDGVIHALKRIIDRAPKGEFADLHDLQNRIQGYESKIAGYRKTRNYWDIAYFRGYQNGLLGLILANNSDFDGSLDIPECFHPGQDEMDLEDFNNIVKPRPEIHKAALTEARRITKKFAAEGLIVQHLPWA